MLAGALAFIALLGKAVPAQEFAWVDAHQFGTEGQGWTATEFPYDRLPLSAKGKAPESVWNLSKHSAGIAIRFWTDSPQVRVRWSLSSDSLAMPHMPATGVSGVDLYERRPNGKWRFVQNGRPIRKEGNETAFALQAHAEGTECLLYLPLYNGARLVELAVPAGKRLERAALRPPKRARPVVYYGTSIAQGACASRPGMAHVAILGRLLDRPFINLGFSGSGRMEASVADLLAELDPAAFVIDCLWNTGNIEDAEFEKRLAYLLRAIRRARPETPVLLIGMSNFRLESHPARQERLQEAVVKQLRREGLKELHLLPGAKLLSREGDGTVDGAHPNDYGMTRHAEAIAPVLARILEGR